MSKKELQEYKDKYGNIPNNFFDRFNYILDIIKPSMKDMEKVKKGIKKYQKNKWIDLDFIFYFIPKATPRARYSGRTRVFYVKNASDNSSIFKEFINSTSDVYELITTSCKFYCDIYMPIPTQMSKAEKILSELKLIPAISKPDWDNTGKTYSDMIQKHLLLDDCLIIDGRVRKFCSFKPRVEIHISYLDGYECKYNKNKIEHWKYYIENKDKINEREAII